MKLFTAVRRVCRHTGIGTNASIGIHLCGYISKYNLIDVDVQVLTETDLHIYGFYKSPNIHTYTCLCDNLYESVINAHSCSQAERQVAMLWHTRAQTCTQMPPVILDQLTQAHTHTSVGERWAEQVSMR